MTTTTRTCPACGYKFRAEPGEEYCSGLCAGTPSLFSLIAAAQQRARSSRLS